jgi:hypothetical protein
VSDSKDKASFFESASHDMLHTAGPRFKSGAPVGGGGAGGPGTPGALGSNVPGVPTDWSMPVAQSVGVGGVGMGPFGVGVGPFGVGIAGGGMPAGAMGALQVQPCLRLAERLTHTLPRVSPHIGSRVHKLIGSTHIGTTHIGTTHTASTHIGSTHIGSTHIASTHI